MEPAIKPVVDGDALVHTDPDGTRRWLVNGRAHRTDGPAVEHADGARLWCRDGLPHRDDGPAYLAPDGTREWWLNHTAVPPEDGAVLNALFDAGETDVIAAVTAAWTPGAALELLVAAARAALA